MKNSEVIRATIDTINQRGWQMGSWGVFKNDGGGGIAAAVCLEGAFAAVLGMEERTSLIDYRNDDPPEEWASWGEWISAEVNACPAAKAVAEYLNHDGYLCGWNDTAIGYQNAGTPEQEVIYHTQEDVICVLEEVAAIEEKKEAIAEAYERAEVEAALAREINLIPDPEEDLVPV